MKKMMTTALMILTLAVLALAPMGAMAEAVVVEDILAVETIDATSILMVDEVVEAPVFRVTFYDGYGNEFWLIDVPQGNYIEMPTEFPVAEGFAFEYWYDAAAEEITPYQFGEVVTGNIEMFAFFTPVAVEVIASEAPIAQEVIEVQTEDLAQQILTLEATEEIVNTDSIARSILSMDTTNEVEAATDVNTDNLIANILSMGTEENVIEDEEMEEIILDDEEFIIEDDEVPLAGPAPTLEVNYSYDGELTYGTVVTATATLHNIPDSVNISFQWQNDATGDYKDVNGATTQSYTFVVDSFNPAGCNWRVNATISA